MALRGFRRTVSLDVSQLADSHDRKTVSSFIVDHFAQYTIHAVQFVGKTARVTFAAEASRQEVVSHQAINIHGVQCAVRGGGPRAQNVLVYNYPVEGSEESIRRVLGAYGVIERVSFRHWVHLTDVSDGVRVVRMVRRQAIPRNLSIDEANVKIAYAGQQQVCDLCDAPGHIARACPFRGKCFTCGLQGHLSRDCPQRLGYRDRDAVDAPDPTPAEAARNDAPVTDAGDADSLDGVSVSSAVVAAAGPAPASHPDVDLDSASDDDLTPSVDPTPSGSLSLDCRDNQLDELSSQPLFTPSASDPDSLQGATFDPACPDSSASTPSPGQGPCHSVSSPGLLDKLKVKVGLNKKKVVSSVSNSSSSNTDISYGNKHSDNDKSITNKKGNKHSDNDMGITNKNGNKHSDNGKVHNSKESDINSNVEYIGQGVLAGRENNSELDLAVETQKRSHPDSDSVDSVDSISFAMPAVPPPRSSKKKPAVVVSPGSSRPVAVDHDRDRSRSRSPKRSSSGSRPPSTGSHALPSSLGYIPKPPRSSSGLRSSRTK